MFTITDYSVFTSSRRAKDGVNSSQITLNIDKYEYENDKYSTKAYYFNNATVITKKHGYDENTVSYGVDSACDTLSTIIDRGTLVTANIIINPENGARSFKLATENGNIQIVIEEPGGRKR